MAEVVPEPVRVRPHSEGLGQPVRLEGVDPRDPVSEDR